METNCHGHAKRRKHNGLASSAAASAGPWRAIHMRSDEIAQRTSAGSTNGGGFDLQIPNQIKFLCKYTGISPHGENTRGHFILFPIKPNTEIRLLSLKFILSIYSIDLLLFSINVYSRLTQA